MRPRSFYIFARPVGLPGGWSLPAFRFARACASVCVRAGFTEVESPSDALFALAPCQRDVLEPADYAAPQLGTLVFHPSALPYRRGPEAIRRTVEAGERVSGVTWFWCAPGYDQGPICVQEPVVLSPDETPAQAYNTRFIPAGLRALARAALAIAGGEVRRADQDESLATYDRGRIRVPPPPGAPPTASHLPPFAGSEPR